MVVNFTEGPPLYGGQDYTKLAMPLHSKALVAAARHLYEEHDLSLEELSGIAGKSALLAEAHSVAHGLPEDVVSRESLPWSIVGAVHRLAGVAP